MSTTCLRAVEGNNWFDWLALLQEIDGFSIPAGYCWSLPLQIHLAALLLDREDEGLDRCPDTVGEWCMDCPEGWSDGSFEDSFGAEPCYVRSLLEYPRLGSGYAFGYAEPSNAFSGWGARICLRSTGALDVQSEVRRIRGYWQQNWSRQHIDLLESSIPDVLK